MIRKKVLGVGVNSATLLVRDSDAENALRVLRRVSVTDWEDDSTKRTLKIYESIKEHSAKMPHVVKIHTILLQNGFLNIVTGYCEGGDLEEYLQHHEERSISEATVFRWLLGLAQAVEELQTKVSASFYGMAFDHVYIDSVYNDEASTPAQLRMGLPVPKHAYFALLAEKRKSHTSLANEYPPEVTDRGSYHPQLSDIWHLGKAGEELLTRVKICAADRSSGAQRLLEKMVSKRLEERPTIDQVITAMSVLAQLESSEPPLRPPGQHPGVVSGGRRSPLNAASLPSAREVAATRPRRRVSSSDWTVPSNKAEDHIVERLAPSTAALETPPSTSPRGVPPRCSPRRKRSSSWHRGAMEKMEELERLNVVSPKTGHGEPHGRHGSARGGQRSETTSAQRYIDAVKEMHLHTGTAAPFQYNREERGRLDNNTRVINHLLGEEAKTGGGKKDDDPKTKTHSGSPLVDTGAQKKTPRRTHPKGLNPPFSYANAVKKREEEAAKNKTLDLAVFEDSNAAHDMKNSRKWKHESSKDKENYVITGSDGIFIYTPMPHRRGNEGSPQREAKQKNAKIPVSIAVPFCPPASAELNEPHRKAITSPLLAAKPLPAAGNRGAPPNVELTVSTTSNRATPQHATPRRALPQNAVPDRSAPQRTTPKRASSSVQPRELIPQPSEPPRYHVEKGVRGQASAPPAGQPTTREAPASPRTQTPRQDRHAEVDRRTPVRAGRQNAESTAATRSSRKPYSRESSVLPASSSPVVMEWAVDSIRSSIRSLVQDRTRYGEIMLEVAAFVRKSEAERLSPEANGRLVRRLNSKLQMDDERAKDAAISLCSQLVALEGLGKLLKDSNQP